MPSHITLITVLTLVLSALSAPIDLASNGSKDSLSPRAVRIKNNELTACPIAGMARNLNGSCVECPAGAYAALGDTSCTTCHPNTFNDLLGASECKSCVPGTKAPFPGMIACITPITLKKQAAKLPAVVVEAPELKHVVRSIEDFSTYLS